MQHFSSLSVYDSCKIKIPQADSEKSGIIFIGKSKKRIFKPVRLRYMEYSAKWKFCQFFVLNLHYV